MTPNAKKILSAKVISVGNFHYSASSQKGIWWATDFLLRGGQSFHVRWDEEGYIFTPNIGNNRLPELKQIFWKKYTMGFGGRGCGFDTKVTLISGASGEDQKAYTSILEPTEIHRGHWEPYPDYRYVPMLLTAFDIHYAYNQKLKAERIMKKATQNMTDALALRKATYDLRDYCC